MEDGIRLLEVVRNASPLFVKQSPHEKKRLLNLVLSNSEWGRGEDRTALRQEFDLFQEPSEQRRALCSKRDPYPEHPVWLGFLEAVLTFYHIAFGEAARP